MKQKIILFRQARTAMISVLLAAGLLASSLSWTLPAHAAGVCPAVGKDTDCGIIITITDKGATVMANGQGPYDGVEDTLVGVVNKTKVPVKALDLSSAQGIFAFDGDGLTTYGVAGNASDNTGYGGPNAYFTKINASNTAGTVNFIKPIAPKGGTGYFALEESINAAVACSTLINNSVTKTVDGTKMKASFTPNNKYSLSDAAALCGFKDFDWLQKFVTLPDPSPYYARNLNGAFDSHVTGKVHLTSASVPFNDPPKGGGYLSQPTDPVDDSYPFYYNPNNGELKSHQSANTTLSFLDIPSDPCLPGGWAPKCNGKLARKGSFIGFTTHLAGVNMDGTETDLDVGFAWKSTFNGTAGGVATTKNEHPVDPGSGTGGVTVTSSQDTTNYEYQGIRIATVTPDAQSVTINVGRHGVLNPKHHGKVKVTIPSTDTFDATTVDPASVTFGPNDAAPVKFEYIHHENGDDDHHHHKKGDKKDLVLYFNMQDTGIKSGDTQACLVGQTFSKDYIKGCATIVTTPGRADNDD